MISENLTEAELIPRLQKSDKAAMRMAYSQNIGYLTAVCSRYIISADDVSDVLQDSFIKIFSSVGSFKYNGDGSLRAWMTRIVVNESLKFLKSMKGNDCIAIENTPDIIDDTNDPDTDDVPAEVIQKMIRELPAGYRAVFNLYVFEDKSHKEIASLLGIKENSSASQLHRAKEILAKKINDYKSGRYGRAMEK